MADGSGGGARKPFSKWTADTERAFLLALRLTGQAKKAAAEIGRSANSAYMRRKHDPEFAARWDAAVAEQQAEWIAAQRARLGDGLDEAGGGRLTRERPHPEGWDSRRRGLFLRALARTKRVDMACEAAGMVPRAAHALRARSPRFAAAWEKALLRSLPSVAEVAYARAVEGWDEVVWRGGKEYSRKRRYAEGALRDLLRLEREAAGARARAAVAAPVPLLPAARRAGATRLPAGIKAERALVQAAHAAARAAGGGFYLSATSEETDAAIMKNLDGLKIRTEREAAESQAREWVRWQRCWAASGPEPARTPAQEVLPPLPEPRVR